MIFDQISGILQLNAIPKETIMNSILGPFKEKIAPTGGSLDKCFTFSLILSISILVLAVILILIKIVKSKPKLLALVTKAKNILCFGMIIKTI